MMSFRYKSNLELLKLIGSYFPQPGGTLRVIVHSPRHVELVPEDVQARKRRDWTRHYRVPLERCAPSVIRAGIPSRNRAHGRQDLAREQIHEAQLIFDELTENQVTRAARDDLVQLLDEPRGRTRDRAQRRQEIDESEFLDERRIVGSRCRARMMAGIVATL